LRVDNVDGADKVSVIDAESGKTITSIEMADLNRQSKTNQRTATRSGYIIWSLDGQRWGTQSIDELVGRPGFGPGAVQVNGGRLSVELWDQGAEHSSRRWAVAVIAP
jgi:hypothetical protein